MPKLENCALFIVNLKWFLINLSLKKLLSHDETEKFKIKKNLNAKVRSGTELESEYSMTNSRNLKEVQPKDSSFVTLAVFNQIGLFLLLNSCLTKFLCMT